jgi:hypothetical protein
MSAEGKELLAAFGRVFAAQLDGALRQVSRNLERAKAQHRKDVALRNYLAELSEEQRTLRVAQLAIQVFAHRLFARLDESSTFSLMARSETGELIDLKEHPDLFAEETNAWCEEFAEHKSVTSDILEGIRRLQRSS